MIALIALPASTTPSVAELAVALRRALGEEFEVRLDPEAPIVNVNAVGQPAKVLVQREPIPWSLLEQPARHARWWPDAEEALREHGGYVTVVVPPGSAKPLHRALLLTHLCAVLGERYEYIGVYWDAATLLHRAGDFSDSAGEMAPSRLPLRLWVDFRVVEEPDYTHSMATLGLEALGVREIEVWGSSAEPQKIIDWAYNTAHYLLTSGATIEEGQTVATSREHWVHVYLRPSMLGTGREVYCLKLDEADAPAAE